MARHNTPPPIPTIPGQFVLSGDGREWLPNDAATVAPEVEAKPEPGPEPVQAAPIESTVSAA